MKHIIRYSFIFLLSFSLYHSCNHPCDHEDHEDAEDQNNPPIIEEITVMPEPPLSIEEPCTLVPIAVDKDGDELKYAWNATGGRFANDSAEEIQVWISSEAGTFTVKCTVNDGKATASESVELLVN